ncbi:MAG: uL14 family ribosomal protein [Candidatus Micrarchaeota archaeon]|nr:uL14 family ribosomal protein [Candidatus Micrarchaeota archaeon]MDE1834656.1 uL14 family ribosomal protein [Candidatus Micrarchaeota archaeon]MDE1859260.1 uL14 family ribosomal protein [Candidatus Micrarchaeota archaeon]
MKGLASRIVKTLVPGAVINCADNSGAYEFRMIHIIGKTGGRHGKMTAAGVGDIVSASVRKGTATYLKKPVRVVIIRQKAPFRRSNGMRIKFEDNAGIMIGDDNLPIGTEVKGAMAREVVERFVKVAGVASRIV